MKTFTLPLPPGINATYRTTRSGGFYTSEKHKTWVDEAGMMLRIAWGNQKPMKGRLIVIITFIVERDRDIDSGIKATLDLFQKMGVYENDRQICSLNVYKFTNPDAPRMEVDIDYADDAFYENKK